MVVGLDTPETVERGLYQGTGAEVARRRGIIALSLAGVASMSVVSLLQTGIVKRLPDPPLPGFDSTAVNLSRTAYRFGVPDGTVSLASLAANVPLAAFGAPGRARAHPWISLLACAKAGAEALAAAWYFYQMPKKERAWCIYCIAGALASVGILVCAVPEAVEAWATLRRERLRAGSPASPEIPRATCGGPPLSCR